VTLVTLVTLVTYFTQRSTLTTAAARFVCGNSTANSSPPTPMQMRSSERRQPNKRTRATSHSPSTPAAARAGSGRCQSGPRVRASFVRPTFVRWAATNGQARGRFQCARTGMSAAGDTALQCRHCLRCHRAVCAWSDIKRASPVNDCTSLANARGTEVRTRCVLRRPRSFLHVASALQPQRACRCPGVAPRILACHKENCSMRERGQQTHAVSLQLNRYKFSAVARCRDAWRGARSGTSP
jgi:hypothetical protein